MKTLYFLAVLCISTAVAVAKDIELPTSTTITGTVSVEGEDFYISTGDTISGPGNGFDLSREPVKNCTLSLEAVSPQKRKALEQELKTKAASRQPVTLKGEFFPLKDRDNTGRHHIAFEVKE
jgi:hypothetical protein